DFWRGEPATLGEFASRITGSSDLYQHDGRRPYASINFVTAHDGFTLHDLVSYNEKHNDANGEDGNDGADDNRSWNCGTEGPTDDPVINDLRARQRRNLLATLLLSQGVPMLLHGDELGRTQQGNNNAYCQDNEISWMKWSGGDDQLVAFTSALTRLRKEHPVFRRRRFFAGTPISKDDELGDIAWFTPSGARMTEQNWDDGFGRAVMVFLNGAGIRDLDQRGTPVVDDSFLMAFNAHFEDIDMTVPGRDYGDDWCVVVDTMSGETFSATDAEIVPAGGSIKIAARSLMVLQRIEPQ
ncbi:MAG TPA: glycogen debranching enzyme, partial [Pseudonocardiaceae bacterium]